MMTASAAAYRATVPKLNSLEARLAKKDLQDLLLNARLARKTEKCHQDINCCKQKPKGMAILKGKR